MKWFLLVLPVLLASCTVGTKHTFHGDVSKIRKVAVASSPVAEKDTKVHLAMGEEARVRGLVTVTHGEDATLRYTDTWTWDMVMYLSRLDVEVVLPNGQIVGSAHYRQPLFHWYPKQSTAVKKVFDELQKAGLGARP